MRLWLLAFLEPEPFFHPAYDNGSYWRAVAGASVSCDPRGVSTEARRRHNYCQKLTGPAVAVLASLESKLGLGK